MNESKNGMVFKSDVMAKINCHMQAYLFDNKKSVMQLQHYINYWMLLMLCLLTKKKNLIMPNG
jgi:hypothetical protein